MPRPAIADPQRNCIACGEPLTRSRFGDRLEDRTRFLARQTCSKTCMGAAMMRDTPSRSALLKRVRHLRKPECEECGTAERLTIHHKDRDWRNNEPANLATLCAPCHMRLHHRLGHMTRS
jgi:hypothetical protein